MRDLDVHIWGLDQRVEIASRAVASIRIAG